MCCGWAAVPNAGATGRITSKPAPHNDSSRAGRRHSQMRKEQREQSRRQAGALTGSSTRVPAASPSHAGQGATPMRAGCRGSRGGRERVGRVGVRDGTAPRRLARPAFAGADPPPKWQHQAPRCTPHQGSSTEAAAAPTECRHVGWVHSVQGMPPLALSPSRGASSNGGWLSAVGRRRGCGVCNVASMSRAAKQRQLSRRSPAGAMACKHCQLSRHVAGKQTQPIPGTLHPAHSSRGTADTSCHLRGRGGGTAPGCGGWGTTATRQSRHRRAGSTPTGPLSVYAPAPPREKSSSWKPSSGQASSLYSLMEPPCGRRDGMGWDGRAGGRKCASTNHKPSVWGEGSMGSRCALKPSSEKRGPGSKHAPVACCTRPRRLGSTGGTAGLRSASCSAGTCRTGSAPCRCWPGG